MFPWVCGGAVHLCVYDQSVSRMLDVETSGLLRGPDGGAGVVMLDAGFYIRGRGAGRNGKDWLWDCWRR